MTTIAVIGTRGFPGIQGGVEVHCQNIYPLMDGVKVRVYRRKPYLSDASHITMDHIEWVDLPSTRIKGFEAVFHTLLCVIHIAMHRPDVVHVHNIGPGMFAPLLRLMGLKVVMTYHSANYEHDKWGAVARTLLRWCESVSLRWCNRVIFVNKFQMEKYPERVRRKSTYIPNGIHTCERVTSTQFLQRHNLMAGEYVLAVGRLTPEKGFEYLVSAVQDIDAVKQLAIAGASDHDDSYYRKLKEIDTNGKVVFTGFTSGHDLQELYSNARLFVLSSVNEGFPLVLLEAMGYGLPIIASDIPATHLVDLPLQCYFTAANTKALSKALTQQLSEPYSLINYDITEFDWQDIANRTCHFILN